MSAHRPRRDRLAGALAALVALLGAVGCGDEVEQVRFRASFDEEKELLAAPVCLGAASLQGFVYTDDPETPLGRLSSVPASLAADDTCRVESGILVVKGVPFGSDRILRLQIADSSNEVLSWGDSEPQDLDSGGAGSDGIPTYEVTLLRQTQFDGTVRLEFPVGTDLSLISGGALGVMFECTPDWVLSRMVDVPASPPDGWEQEIYVSGLQSAPSCTIKVLGRDSTGAEAARWISQGEPGSVVIETTLDNNWAVVAVPLLME